MYKQPRCPGFFFCHYFFLLGLGYCLQKSSHRDTAIEWHWLIEVDECWIWRKTTSWMLFCVRLNDLLHLKSSPYFTVYVYVCLCVNMHVYPCIHIESAGTCKNWCQMSSSISVYLFLKYKIFLCVWVFYFYVYALCVCLGPIVVRRGHWVLCN